MKQLFLSSLSKALNAYLALDPASDQRLQKLKMKTITLELLPLHLKFHCFFTETAVTLKMEEDSPADAYIKGTPLQLLSIMITKENRQRFFAEDISIEGNAEIAEEVMALFDDLEIDWEEYFSRLIGDIPAYRTRRFLNQVGNWVQETKEIFRENIDDYVHEEKECLPTREALEDFFGDIDTLRMDIDRLEARIALLRAELEDA